MSYRTWRRLAGQTKLIRAEATGSHEYVALIGVQVATTMGVGIIWPGIPLMLLTLCVRIR